MYCKYCGKESKNSMAFCEFCGQKLLNNVQPASPPSVPLPAPGMQPQMGGVCRCCGKPLHPEAELCMHCGTATGHPTPVHIAQNGELANGTLCLLSFLSPPIGFLAFCLYAHSYPRAAKAYVNAAMIGLVAYILIYIFLKSLEN